MTNMLCLGDRVVMCRFGQFSHLWVDMAERFGLKVDVTDVEWGAGVPVEIYAEKLAKDKEHRIKAVFCTHNETATGVTSDVAAVRAALDAARHPALSSWTVSPRSAPSSFARKSGAWTAASADRRKASCFPPALAFFP